jgi:group II intron reverse transcriptase/maturase
MSEGSLHRSDKLLCEQRRNQPQLPRSGVRGQDANAAGWGSEAVVVDGVTSVRGARESRVQGEGPQDLQHQGHWKLLGRVTLGRLRRYQPMKNVASEMEHLNKLARKDPCKRFTRLWSNITSTLWLAQAWEQIRRNHGSNTPGADSLTGWDVDPPLIASLSTELLNGTYRPTPVRRVYIPKANGKTRPLGIPTLKDRIVQQALRMALEPIFEADFKPFSHGFRQHRSTHTALQEVVRNYPPASWIIEGDIEGFYDNLPHDLLLEQVRRRIADEKVIGLIGKFLKAGYLENWRFHSTYSGVPQGGIVSPLLSNIFGHQLDLFMEDELGANRLQTQSEKNARANPEYRRISTQISRLRGKLRESDDKAVYLELKELEERRKHVPCYSKEKRHPGKIKYVRYADDFLILIYGTKLEAEGTKRRVADKLRELGLQLNDEKTRITHWDEPVQFLGYELRGISRKRGIGIRARLGIPREKVKRIQEAIMRVCEYHQIPEADLFRAVSAKYQGFCQYFKYADAPQQAFSKLADSSWWATAHNLARRHKCSMRQMLRTAEKAERYAYLTRRGRTRKTFRQFIGSYEVILDILPPKTGNIHAIPKHQSWTADLIPLNACSWQSGRSLATRLEALERSTGVCEQCHTNQVENVHHTGPLRRKRSMRARVMSDRDQRLTAKALCMRCHVGVHGGQFPPKGARKGVNPERWMR